MRAPDDPYPDILGKVIRALLASEETTALRALDEMPFEPLRKRTERWPAHSVIVRVFARDRYQCRYCGERVILPQVMRLIARLYPDRFPYHQNWKADSTHPAFISRGATLDHVVPIAFGGDPLAESNLVTACWGCNRRKGDSLLDEIGWELRDPSDATWYGFADLYEPLWRAVGTPPLGEDERAYMRAVQRQGFEREGPTAAPSP